MVWGLVSGIRWSDRSDEAFVVTAGCDASGDRGHRLPASPRAPSGPMSPEDPTNEPWLRRVQAMLAKAESTQFPDEDEDLLAKAQELMSRHAIDEAKMQYAGRAASDAVTHTVVVTTAPYAGAKASLLGAIAAANPCRVIMQTGGGGERRGRTCTLVGPGSDIARVEIGRAHG